MEGGWPGSARGSRRIPPQGTSAPRKRQRWPVVKEGERRGSGGRAWPRAFGAEPSELESMQLPVDDGGTELKQSVRLDMNTIAVIGSRARLEIKRFAS